MATSGAALSLLYGDREEFGRLLVLYPVDLPLVTVRYAESKDSSMTSCFHLISLNSLSTTWKGYKKCNLICYILVFNESISLLRCRRKLTSFSKRGSWRIFSRKSSWEDELCICLRASCRCLLDWLHLSRRLSHSACSFFKELPNLLSRMDSINGKLSR